MRIQVDLQPGSGFDQQEKPDADPIFEKKKPGSDIRKTNRILHNFNLEIKFTFILLSSDIKVNILNVLIPDRIYIFSDKYCVIPLVINTFFSSKSLCSDLIRPNFENRIRPYFDNRN